MDYIKLNNGNAIPMLGLGTYLLSPKDAERSVHFALNNGYSLIDTANAYVNEKGVGRGLKGIDRSKIYLETKLWPCFYNDDKAIDNTLKRLDVDYIDLMILHQPSGDILAGYKNLERYYKLGKLKAIGISNFNINEIKLILDNCEIKPALIQVECHPYCSQKELKEFLKKYDIAIQAWYPLGGRGNNSILEEPIIKELANKYNKSCAQIILRWHIEMGNIVIPGSKTESHILDNINIFDFSLNEEDMKRIASLDKNQPFYIRDDSRLKQFGEWRPDVDGQE